MLLRGTKTSCDTMKLLNFPSGFSHNSKFSPISFDGIRAFGYRGSKMWTDGTNIYYTDGSSQYVLNKSTRKWEEKTQSGISDVSFFASLVWTDGTNIYHTNGGTTHILDGEVWRSKSWNLGVIPDNIWTDGQNVYYSTGTNQYILNKQTDTWEEKVWNGLESFNGNRIWSDGTDIYYSSDSGHYVLHGDTWEEKVWNYIPTNLYSSVSYIWSDGTDTYWSTNGTQYVLNKETATWEEKTWEGLPKFYGADLWSDGNCIYYTFNSFNDSEPQGEYILLPSTAALYSRVSGEWVKFASIS